MSESIGGTFADFFTPSRKERKAAPRPDPDYQWPKIISGIQIFCSVVGIFDGMGGAVLGNPVGAVSAAFNFYNTVRGIHNYRHTSRSAEESVLRKLLGDQMPANDNFLTPKQSLSNSFTLLSQTSASIAIRNLIQMPLAMANNDQLSLSLSAWTAFINVGSSAGNFISAKINGPARMPGFWGRIKPPKGP